MVPLHSVLWSFGQVTFGRSYQARLGIGGVALCHTARGFREYRADRSSAISMVFRYNRSTSGPRVSTSNSTLLSLSLSLSISLSLSLFLSPSLPYCCFIHSSAQHCARKRRGQTFPVCLRYQRFETFSFRNVSEGWKRYIARCFQVPNDSF